MFGQKSSIQGSITCDSARNANFIRDAFYAFEEVFKSLKIKHKMVTHPSAEPWTPGQSTLDNEVTLVYYIEGSKKDLETLKDWLSRPIVSDFPEGLNKREPN